MGGGEGLGGMSLRSIVKIKFLMSQDYQVLSSKFRARVEQYSEFMTERVEIQAVSNSIDIENALNGRGGWRIPVQPHGET